MAFSTHQEVFRALSQHLEFIPYINMYVLYGNPSNSPNCMTQDQRLESLLRISKFYNTYLVDHKPKHIKLNHELQSLTGIHKKMYHSLIFVENEIYMRDEAKFDKNTNLLQQLIDFLVKIPNNINDICVNINEQKLYDDILSEDICIKPLKAFWNFKYSLVIKVANALTTFEENRDELRRIIELMSLSLKDESTFFSLHPLQPSFEKILMSDLLPYSSDINAIIDDFGVTSPDMFVSELFDQAVVILKDLQFTESRHDMALILSLYRYIFDRIYYKNQYLNPEIKSDQMEKTDIVTKLRFIPMQKLMLPKDYTPDLDQTQPSFSFFKNDEFFSKAVDALEMIQFYVNPFDILNAVAECISFIEIAAMKYATDSSTNVLAFEVMFTLFTGVLLSSNITNWENLSNFVCQYTPQTGLAPKFEYAKTKMEASLARLQELGNENFFDSSVISPREKYQAPLYVC